MIASLFSIGLFHSTIFFFSHLTAERPMATGYRLHHQLTRFVDLQSTLSIPLCMSINVQLMVIAGSMYFTIGNEHIFRFQAIKEIVKRKRKQESIRTADYCISYNN